MVEKTINSEETKKLKISRNIGYFKNKNVILGNQFEMNLQIYYVQTQGYVWNYYLMNLIYHYYVLIYIYYYQ